MSSFTAKGLSSTTHLPAGTVQDTAVKEERRGSKANLQGIQVFGDGHLLLLTFPSAVILAWPRLIQLQIRGRCANE